MEKQYCVISHTHWDREWYVSFEEFRYRFVKLMDNVLHIIKDDPQYIFHLDAQTLIVEDYLEIRPHRKAEVENHIASGNLLVGPWFIQGDFHLTSGEAIIRNLLYGHRLADKLGKCQHTGYAPDQFGLCSQVPQIFNGFNLKGCVFGRGYKKYKEVDDKLELLFSPSEFLWQSPDGSSILGISLHHWYNNAQRFSEDPVKAMKLIQHIEDATKEIALTPFILLMNGVDHLEAQENLLPILEKLNQNLPSDQSISQTTLDKYIDDVSTHLQNNINPQLITQQGEMRHGAHHILMNTLSSRVYLKQSNFRAQNTLESILEPIYAFIFALGAQSIYPTDHFNYLWRLLMQNHPHDSICGCSTDDVHTEMETRFQKVENLSKSLLADAQTFITDHVDRSDMDENDYLLAIYNMTEVKRQAVIEVDLSFPRTENVNNFEILDTNGQNLPFSLVGKTERVKQTVSPINLPGTLDVDCYRIQLLTNIIPSLAYEALRIKPCAGMISKLCKKESETIQTNSPVIIENEILSVTVHTDGQIDLKVKATDYTYTDILHIMDREDTGHSYIYRRSENGETILNTKFKPQIKRLANTPLRQQYQIHFDMILPTHYDFDKDRRASQTSILPVDLILTLDSQNPGLQLSIQLTNTVKDHRIRALFNTGYKTDTCYASQPFDIIARSPYPLSKEQRNGDEPNSGMLCIEGPDHGIAVFNKGLYEYEYPVEHVGQLALTLVRSNSRLSGWDPKEITEQFSIPGNQCQRQFTFELLIRPYQNDYVSAQIAAEAKSFHNPLLSIFQPVDRKKFTGGRPAVQDTEIQELFYQPLPFPEVKLPLSKQLFEIQGDHIQLSALKLGEDDTILVIRLWNTGNKKSTFGLQFHQLIKHAAQINLNEEVIRVLPVKDMGVKDIAIKSREIITLSVWI